jgi:HSP20 family molecular chaperone IbpA
MKFWSYYEKVGTEVNYDIDRIDNIVTLKLYIPGVKKKDIEVSYDDKLLRVKYRSLKTPESAENEILDFPASSFGPDFVICDSQAAYEDGILYVDLRSKEQQFKIVKVY